MNVAWRNRPAGSGAACLRGVVGMLLMAGTMFGQVLVYEMEFEPERGYNAPDLEGGYAVVPVGGGTGSFVFTFDVDGSRTYTEASNTASFYPASTAKGERKWVLQASVTSSTESISGAYVAFGESNRKVRVTTTAAEVESKIAQTMKGRVVASSSAVDTTDASVVGFASMVDWENTFRRQLTNEVNRLGLDVAGATTYITDLLDARGFNDNPSISGSAISITTTTLSAATLSTAYSATLSATGATGTVTWSLQSGSALPAGLSLSTSGAISGTPTATGTTSFTVVASSGGASDTQSLSLTVGS